jgi:hypothetical protein
MRGVSRRVRWFLLLWARGAAVEAGWTVYALLSLSSGLVRLKRLDEKGQ